MVSIWRGWYALLLLSLANRILDCADALHLVTTSSVWVFLKVAAALLAAIALGIYSLWNFLLALRNLLNDMLDGFS